MLEQWSPLVREFLDAVHNFSFPLYQALLLPMIFFSIFFYLLAFTGIFIKPEKRKEKNIKKWPFVTVQIPTFNESVALRCARKCLEFEYPSDSFEIIIGDDSNDERVSRMIDDFARNYPKKIKVTRRGSNSGFKAGNLNHMLRHSKGEIIVIFDSDFVPPKKFLKKIVSPFLEDERVGCVQAGWKFMNMYENGVSKLASAVLALYQRILAIINSKNGVSLLFGSAQAIRRDLLFKLGGWQEGSLTEDVEFSLRLLKNGYKTVYLSGSKVPGEVPFTIKGFFRQQRRWAYGNAKAFLQHLRWLLFDKRFSILQKSLLTFTLLGYFSAPFLVFFTLFGIISFMTGEPAAIDVVKFFKETGWTFFVNSGFMAAILVALWKEKKLDILLSVLGSSVIVGFIASIGITQGLINAFLGRKMGWSLIEKKGNKV